MFKSWSCLATTLLISYSTISSLLCAVAINHHDAAVADASNSIAAPGQPLYYLMADAGSTVGPNVELKRTNRSLMKWWEDLFNQNNCCNNNNLVPPLAPVAPVPAIGLNSNCNGLQLQDPFKQMKLFKKLPDLWGNNCAGQCGQCGGQQPALNNYAPPLMPGYGGEGYAPPPPPSPPAPAAPVVGPAPADYNNPAQVPAQPGGGYETPNPAYDGPGDGDAGYVPPVGPVGPVAPTPAADPYVSPPAAADYQLPETAPAAPAYETPSIDTAPQPSYGPTAPAPESYSKTADYAKPEKSYGSVHPQIVYQPIIYLSASPDSKPNTDSKLKETVPSYEAQPQAPPPPPPPAPVYEPPATPPAMDLPVYPTPPAPPTATGCNTPACGGYLPLVGVPFYLTPSAAPAAAAPVQPAPPAYVAPPVAPPPMPSYAAPQSLPTYSAPPCETPIRLSVIDQPYRVAPELFKEYNYRLALAEHNRL